MWAQDEDAHAGSWAFADSLNDRKHESSSFTGAGFSTAYQILPGENDRYCFRLYRGWIFVSEGLTRTQLCVC